MRQGFVAPSLLRLGRAGDGEELPHLLAGFGVDAEDRTAVGPLAALGADDDLVLDQERRAGEPDGELLRIDQLRIPHRFAGLHVDGDQSSVNGADVQVAVAHCHAAVEGRVGLARDSLLVELGNVGPQDIAGVALDGEDLAVGSRVVKDSVLCQRRRLETAGRAANLLDKRHFQFLDVLGVDLLERTVVPIFVAAVESLPVLIRLRKRLGVLRVGGRRQGRGREQRRRTHHQLCSKIHHHSPPLGLFPSDPSWQVSGFAATNVIYRRPGCKLRRRYYRCRSPHFGSAVKIGT